MQHVSVTYEPTTISDAPAVTAYLDGCIVVWMAAHQQPDALTRSTHPCVPIGVASDGVFAWPLATSYYVRNHQLSPDRALLHRVRARHYQPPPLAVRDVHTTITALRNPTSAARSHTTHH